MALSDYEIALANFNAAMNADPLLRALNEERRAWGDIMYDEDMLNNPTPVRETTEQFLSRHGITPQAEAPPSGEPQQLRTWTAPMPQRQRRFDQQPNRHVRPPLPQRQAAPPLVAQPLPAAPVQKQQKRPRNTFAALDNEDSE